MTQQELARCLAYRINVGKENYKNHPDLYKHHHGPVTYHVNRKLSHKVKYV